MKWLIALMLMLFVNNAWGANYPIEITNPQSSLNTNSRYYKTYPGIKYEVPVTVFGGTYPFAYSLTTAPSGMTIDVNTGVITWPSPTTTGSPHSVTALVQDSEGNSDTVSWTIIVSTANTIFVDCSAATSGTGTIDSPFNALSDVHLGTRDDSTYQNYQMILRAGTCDLQNMSYQGSTSYSPPTDYQDAGVQWSGAKPLVWIGYPGESVIIDHDLNMDFGYAFRLQDSSPVDMFVQNIRFQDATNHVFRTGPTTVSRNVWYDNTFTDIGPGGDGANSSMIMFVTSGQSGTHRYSALINNVFNNGDTVAFVKTYSTQYLVVEGNTFTNPIGSCEGLALKAYDELTSVRNNVFIGDYSSGALCGNMNNGGYSAGDYDISFNKFLDSDTDGDARTYGAMNLNHDVGITAPIYVYRNTIEGAVQYRGSSPTYPLHFYNNVIINNMSAIDSPDGSLLHPWPETVGGVVSNSNIISLGVGDDADLTGSTTDGIIDTAGLLTGTYRTTYLDLKGHEVTGSLSYNTCYPDVDGDFYPGTGSESVETCSTNYYTSSHFTSMTADCNDTDHLINPGATEVCGDGIDNDCVGGDASCGTASAGSQAIFSNGNWAVSSGGSRYVFPIIE